MISGYGRGTLDLADHEQRFCCRAATRAARARQAATGEPYAEAQRNTSAPAPAARRAAPSR
ncbi:hypothetical protein NUM_07280 [Actinocatenispora comari]|uniref:Uncharacterized protein n=1 Tax=Actinocatenispora comari TaxID=2807577 RepID=A0A8J4AB12_9ACTN|nr:hypothetical protein NUM_07280 [Actinocatenispora comari]